MINSDRTPINGGCVLTRDGIPYGVSDNGNSTAPMMRLVSEAEKTFGKMVVIGKAGTCAMGERILYICSPEDYRKSSQGALIRLHFESTPEGMTTQDFAAVIPELSYHTVREYIARALVAGMLSVKDRQRIKHKPGVPGRILVWRTE